MNIARINQWGMVHISSAKGTTDELRVSIHQSTQWHSTSHIAQISISRRAETIRALLVRFQIPACCPLCGTLSLPYVEDEHPFCDSSHPKHS